MKYKVSIVIPVYNAEKFILDTLKTIENQTMDFEDIEVILVNDCSSDDTAKIIKKYARVHENIVLINLPKNAGGPAIPRNIGITFASADYLMFLDQDDIFRPNACEVLYDKISSNNVDVVCGNHNIVFNGNSRLYSTFDWAESDELFINDIEENPDFLSLSVVAWSKIFKKDFILKNNIKFVESVCEDTFFSVRALLLAKGIILLKNFIVVDYQVREESLSHQIDFDYVKEFTQFHLIFFDYFEDNNYSNDIILPLFNTRMESLLSVLLYSEMTFNEQSLALNLIKSLFVKLNDKSFYFYNIQYELFYKVLLLDKSPYKKTIDLYEFLKEKKIKLNDDFKFKSVSCKLCINDNFEEIAYYNLSEDAEIKFDISKYRNIKDLCFYPICDAPVVCEINNISSENYNLSFKSDNAFHSNNSEEIFLTSNPKYYIECDLINEEYLKFNFKVDYLSEEILENILREGILD